MPAADIALKNMLAVLSTRLTMPSMPLTVQNQLLIEVTRRQKAMRVLPETPRTERVKTPIGPGITLIKNSRYSVDDRSIALNAG